METEFDRAESDAEDDEHAGIAAAAPGIPHAGERLSLPDRRLITVGEVVEVTGLSASAVYRAIWDGELRASKLRGRLRVQLADLDVWVDSNRVTTRDVNEEPPAPARPLGQNGPGRGLRELFEAE